MVIKECKKIFSDKLQEDMMGLEPADRLVVEYPISVEDYKLNHPKGALLIIYKGADYDKSEAADAILQNKDMQIGVVVVCRLKTTGMAPEDYLDWVREKMSGYAVDEERAEKKIYPLTEEWIKEEQGIWWYGITFFVPAFVIEIQE